jgi:hypothetical protein
MSYFVNHDGIAPIILLFLFSLLHFLHFPPKHDESSHVFGATRRKMLTNLEEVYVQ